MFEKFGERLASYELRTFVLTWCIAARAGFTIRLNLAHGVPGKLGETLAYMRNPRWEGEERKRGFGNFWADAHTLDLVRDAMATLFRSVGLLTKDGANLAEVVTPEAQRALRTAPSVPGEFASQAYNPNFEKY